VFSGHPNGESGIFRPENPMKGLGFLRWGERIDLKWAPSLLIEKKLALEKRSFSGHPKTGSLGIFRPENPMERKPGFL